MLMAELVSLSILFNLCSLPHGYYMHIPIIKNALFIHSSQQ